MRPEGFAVIGHMGGLLVESYTVNAMHIYILSECSTPAIEMCNPRQNTIILSVYIQYIVER